MATLTAETIQGADMLLAPCEPLADGGDTVLAPREPLVSSPGTWRAQGFMEQAQPVLLPSKDSDGGGRAPAISTSAVK